MSNLYYRGDSIFLYTQFMDENEIPCSAANVKVRILHDKEGTIYQDLEWTDMQQMSTNEYYYNFKIPHDSDTGQYQIIYSGEINNQPAYIVEVFHIIAQSNKYPNAVKVYGYIHDIYTTAQLIDATISIYDSFTGGITYQSMSNLDGYWEAFLYPGEYRFSFIKNGYITLDIVAQIGDQNTEIEFNNVGLENMQSRQNGNGMYSIKDSYVTKYHVPLRGLNISIANIKNPSAIIATDTTDIDGNWECFVDPGIYIMKITGTVSSKEYNKTFRVKVEDNGDFKFEDLSKNVATVVPNPISPSAGSSNIDDVVKDRDGNPIIDVQVNVFKKGVILDDKNILAQTYTDVQGRWSFNLDPGEYVIEYYHPKFKTITENKIVN